MKQQKTIHGLSAKQRFFPLFDALVLGALLVGLMWIPENILHGIGFASLGLIICIWTFLLWKFIGFKGGRFFLALSMVFLVVPAYAEFVPLADIHVVAYTSDTVAFRGDYGDQCVTSFKERTGVDGKPVIPQEKLDAWVKQGKFRWTLPDYCYCKDVADVARERWTEALDILEELEKKPSLTEEEQITWLQKEEMVIYFTHCEMYDAPKICQTPHEYMVDNTSSCRTCRLMGLFLTAIDAVASSFHKYLSDGHKMLVVSGVCFCLWLIWQVACALLGLISHVDFAKNFFVKGLLVMFMSLLIMEPLSTVVDYVATPAVKVTSSLMKSINETIAPKGFKFAGTSTKVYCDDPDSWDLMEFESMVKTEGKIEPVLPKELKTALICPISQSYDSVATFLAVGQALTCDGRYGNVHGVGEDADANDFLEELYWPNWEFWLTGMIIQFCSYFLMAIVPFFLVDVFLFMSLFFVPFPVWCLAAMYKPTRGYAKRAFLLFIHSLLCLVTLTIGLAFILQCFQMIIAPSGGTTLNELLSDPETTLDALKAIFYLNGKMILLAVAIVFLSFKLLTVFATIADKIVGVSVGGFANTVREETLAVYHALTDDK